MVLGLGTGPGQRATRAGSMRMTPLRVPTQTASRVMASSVPGEVPGAECHDRRVRRRILRVAGATQVQAGDQTAADRVHGEHVLTWACPAEGGGQPQTSLAGGERDNARSQPCDVLSQGDLIRPR